MAVLWWLLIYWSEELVAKSRILQTQVIGHLTERLPTLRGGVQDQSSLSQSEYSAPEPPKLEKLNRDRETPHDVSPPTPPGIRVTYHGGSNLFKFHLAASSGSPKFLKYLFGSAR